MLSIVHVKKFLKNYYNFIDMFHLPIKQTCISLKENKYEKDCSRQMISKFYIF